MIGCCRIGGNLRKPLLKALLDQVLQRDLQLPSSCAAVSSNFKENSTFLRDTHVS